MHGKYLVAVAVGLVLGVVGTMVALRQPPAQAQAQERKARWEYQVIRARTDLPGKEGDDKPMTKEFGRLAADGWEYVGPAAEPERSIWVYLVFRRQKP